MKPTVLPHTAVGEFAERSGLSGLDLHGPRGLHPMLTQALDRGARVFLVLWAAPDWQLLAIKPPEDAAHLSDLEVLALVGGWPGLVAEMLGKSQCGAHYTWLELRCPSARSNAVH